MLNPVTLPVVSTEAIALLLLDHVTTLSVAEAGVTVGSIMKLSPTLIVLEVGETVIPVT